MQAGRIAQAAEVARQTAAQARANPGDAHWWMLAHARNGDAADAAGIAMALQPADLPNARVATVAVRALLDDDRVEAAILLATGRWTRATMPRRCAHRWGWRTCGAPPTTTASGMPWRTSRRA
ncbi:hypothetical protein WJ972_05050 [Achromobacter insuavis]